MMGMLYAGSLLAQTTHTIADDGFAFSPDSLSINVGDSVSFTGNDFHPVLEVSENTWNDNGVTALSGGFAFPNGNGKLLFSEAGTHYYVCTAHVANHGMKGRIFVSSPTSVPGVKNSLVTSVYPVPLTGSTLFVGLNKGGQSQAALSVYDLAGQLMINAEVSGHNGVFGLDCSGLSAGSYVLKVSMDGKNEFVKFVKR